MNIINAEKVWIVVQIITTAFIVVMQVVRPGGGGYRSPGSSYQKGPSKPLSTQEKAVLKGVGVVGIIMLPVAVAALMADAGWAALFFTPLRAVIFGLTALLTLPTAGVGALFSTALWGAAIGLVIGWLRRVRLVRHRLTGEFIGAFFSSKIWEGQSQYPVLEVAVRTFAGYVIGLAFSAEGLFAPGAAPVLQALAVAAAGGNGGGGEDPLALAYVALWIAAILIGIIVAALSTRLVIWILLHRVGFSAAHGAVSGAVKGLMATLSEDWGREMQELDRRAILKAAFWRGAVKGTFTGAIVGGVLLLFVG